MATLTIKAIKGTYVGKVPLDINPDEGGLGVTVHYLRDESWVAGHVYGGTSLTSGVYNRVWWEADKDLLSGLVTQLKITITGTETYYTTNTISVSVTRADAQGVGVVGTAGIPFIGNTPTITGVVLNPEGYTVHGVRAELSQHFSDNRCIRVRDFTTSDLTNTVIDKDAVRLVGTEPIHLFDAETLLPDNLLFALHLDADPTLHTTSWSGYGSSTHAITDWAQDVAATISTGTTVTSDRVGLSGGALDLSNSAAKITIDTPGDVVLPSAYTVSVHFKTPLATANYNVLCTATDDKAIAVRQLTDNKLGILDLSGPTFVASTVDFDDLDPGWHHLAAKCSGGTTLFYLDGEYVGSAADMMTGNLKQINGDGLTGTNWPWSSGVDAFRLYNYGLLAADIALLATGIPYDETTGTVSDVIDAGTDVFWYRIDYHLALPGGSSAVIKVRTCLDTDGEEGLSSRDWVTVTRGTLGFMRGRYLQWSIEYTSDTMGFFSPRLYHIDFDYETQTYNHAVDEVSVHPNSAVYDNYTDWGDCSLVQVDRDYVPGDVCLESVPSGYYPSGSVSDVLNAGRDVSWGLCRVQKTAPSGTNIDIYFRSATNAEGEGSLSGKSWEQMSSGTIPCSAGRYLEWKAELACSGVPWASGTPLLHRLELWLVGDKYLYAEQDDWLDCTFDDTLQNGDAVVLASTGGIYEDSGTISGIADAGSDGTWSYLLHYAGRPVGTDVTFHYRYATDAEGQGALSGKEWVALGRVNIYNLVARYVEWRATLTANRYTNETPTLYRVLLGRGTTERVGLSPTEISDANLGKLEARLLGDDDTHSAEMVVGSYTRSTGVDTIVTQTNLAPVIQWSNVLASGEPLPMRYLFNFFDDDGKEDVDGVIEYSKVGDTDFNDYTWKMDTVTVGSEGITLDDEYYLGGAIRYLLDAGKSLVWRKFKADDNHTHSDDSIRIAYFVRFSMSGAYWTEWQQVRPGDALLDAGRYAEIRVVLRRMSGIIAPAVTYIALEAWSGEDFYIVDIEEGDYTSIDMSVQDQLTNGEYYYYRVKAFDGADMSLWSRTRVIQAQASGYEPGAPNNLRVDGMEEPSSVVSFSPVLTWAFVDDVLRSQENARVQVGRASGVWDAWDTGKEATTTGLTYGQQTDDTWLTSRVLEEGKTYYWHVRTWNDMALASPFSAIAQFSLNITPTRPELLSVYPFESSSSSSPPPPSSSSSDEEEITIPTEGMRLWLKPSTLRRGGWNDGDQVSLWEDESGNGRHARHDGDMAIAPVYRSDTVQYGTEDAAVEFSQGASERGLLLPNTIFPIDGPFTCYIVFGVVGGDYGTNTILGAEDHMELQMDQENYYSQFYMDKVGHPAEGTLGETHLWTGPGQKFWWGVEAKCGLVSGTKTNSLKLTWFSATTNSTNVDYIKGIGNYYGLGACYGDFGGHYLDQFFVGWIAEVIIYDGYKTGADSSNIQSYLSSKYGLNYYMPI